MNRRGFLGALTGLAATLTLDPEKLLWRPGERKIFIPGDNLKIGDIITFEYKFPPDPYSWHGEFHIEELPEQEFYRRYMWNAGDRAGRLVHEIIVAEYSKQ